MLGRMPSLLAGSVHWRRLTKFHQMSIEDFALSRGRPEQIAAIVECRAGDIGRCECKEGFTSIRSVFENATSFVDRDKDCCHCMPN